MAGNTFGKYFQVHSFGESHGGALGCVVDGCPAGVPFDLNLLAKELERRRPGQVLTSQRKESDVPEVLSGVFEGKTLGTPIAIMVRNQDARSEDYAQIQQTPRAGHADDMWSDKYGHRDHRGGGRSSGRETVARVMAGAVAKMLLKKLAPELNIVGFATEIGAEKLSTGDKQKFLIEASSKTDAQDQYTARFPSADHLKIKTLLEKTQSEGNSVGGSVEVRVFGTPRGLGQPVFHKLKADLAAAMMSVGATHSFSIGEDVDAGKSGVEFHRQKNQSQYGGIRGGISTGEDLIINVGFKPTSSLLDVAKKGRHDPCIVPRAIPVLESMVAIVLADHMLAQRLDRV